jgi:hypothetical protein
MVTNKFFRQKFKNFLVRPDLRSALTPSTAVGSNLELKRGKSIVKSVENWLSRCIFKDFRRLFKKYRFIFDFYFLFLCTLIWGNTGWVINFKVILKIVRKGFGEFFFHKKIHLKKNFKAPKRRKIKKNNQNGTNTWKITSKKSTCGLFTYIAFTEL